jgi:hypothetical protein
MISFVYTLILIGMVIITLYLIHLIKHNDNGKRFNNKT